MATITLNLSKKIDELGKSELLIRFSASRTQRYRINSGIFVNEKRWTKRNELSIPKIDTPERRRLVQLAEKIELLKKHILTQYEISDKSKLTKEWLEVCVDMFHFPEKYYNEQSFFDVVNDYFSKRKMSYGRQKSVKVVFRSMRRFELYKQKFEPNFILKLEDFTLDLLHDFEHYLKIEIEVYKTFPDIFDVVKESRVPAERSQNTITDMLVKLRTFFIWCHENNLIKNNPFAKFSIDQCVYGTPYYITIEERNHIYKHDFSNRPALAIQRDIFVFQCLVGCRIGDLYGLKKSNIINGAIEYIARKTKDGNPVTVRVPLNSIALEIIRRYEQSGTDSLFPFISEQNYNYAIKEIFLLAGITRIVTVLNPRTRQQEQVPINEVASSHLARRCFIGNLYKQVKDPNLVGSLSGHKEGSKAFARYRDIDDDIKNDLVNLLL